MDQRTSQFAEQPGTRSPALAATIYLAAFITGAIVMSFEMLGSRYLNPYFGSGIYTWASLISTVLAALCVGYFVGGIAADRYPSRRRARRDRADRIGLHPGAAGCSPKRLMEAVLAGFDDVKTGSLAAAFAILFFPVTFLGMYLAVRHPAAAALGAKLGARSPARSTASPPPAASSARSAPPSSSFRRSARARSRSTLGARRDRVRPRC